MNQVQMSSNMVKTSQPSQSVHPGIRKLVVGSIISRICNQIKSSSRRCVVLAYRALGEYSFHVELPGLRFAFIVHEDKRQGEEFAVVIGDGADELLVWVQAIASCLVIEHEFHVLDVSHCADADEAIEAADKEVTKLGIIEDERSSTVRLDGFDRYLLVAANKEVGCRVVRLVQHHLWSECDHLDGIDDAVPVHDIGVDHVLDFWKEE